MSSPHLATAILLVLSAQADKYLFPQHGLLTASESLSSRLCSRWGKVSIALSQSVICFHLVALHIVHHPSEEGGGTPLPCNQQDGGLIRLPQAASHIPSQRDGSDEKTAALRLFEIAFDISWEEKRLDQCPRSVAINLYFTCWICLIIFCLHVMFRTNGRIKPVTSFERCLFLCSSKAGRCCRSRSVRVKEFGFKAQ